MSLALNAYNEDLGRLTDTNRDMMLDRNILINQRKRFRIENKPVRQKLGGLYFDGKKDMTIQKNGPSTVEEHITFINEPGHHYITHTSPISGKSEHVAASIINGMTEEELEELKVVGADGTSGNTGVNKGVIMRIEYHLHRKLHWNVCNIYVCSILIRNTNNIIAKYMIDKS